MTDTVYSVLFATLPNEVEDCNTIPYSGSWYYCGKCCLPSIAKQRQPVFAAAVASGGGSGGDGVVVAAIVVAIIIDILV